MMMTMDYIVTLSIYARGTACFVLCIIKHYVMRRYICRAVALAWRSETVMVFATVALF